MVGNVIKKGRKNIEGTRVPTRVHAVPLTQEGVQGSMEFFSSPQFKEIIPVASFTASQKARPFFWVNYGQKLSGNLSVVEIENHGEVF